MLSPLIAVHLSDGVLNWPWHLCGFVVALKLLTWGSRNITDEEIPRIGMIAAVFFISSQIHLSLGPSSVHLLLNGLAGVILGKRAVIAIAVGLFLQMALLGHGGYWTLGLNLCIMALPSLFAGRIYKRFLYQKQDGIYLYSMLIAFFYMLHPQIAVPIAVLAACRIYFQTDPVGPHVFRAGFAVGFMCVVLTVLGNCLVLILGGNEDWTFVAVAVFVAHLPVALLEGLIVGYIMRFLARARPEVLPNSS